MTPLLLLLVAPAAPPETKVDFNRDVRPILADHCFQCHGPDAQKRKADLRLDVDPTAQKRDAAVIVPGKPNESELIRRVSAEDPSDRMPPMKFGRQLSEKQIEILKIWTLQGGKWERHWALIPRTSPPVPVSREPKASAWVRNPIDAFILARLEKEGLAPSKEADRTTQIRRMTFDLTGLPPTPAEVDAFVNDKSPNAVAKLADRLLASPRYGERMAWRWLEAARYADTHGYQTDGEREMWRWRDWVIEAYNRNLPFDQFTIEQLAGDLLPNPTLDQRIATGFNRNHRGNSDGGIVAAEYAVEYVVDRVDTVSTVFLGLTMGCARCHNHKYDPVTQKEYYQLYAYFNSIPEDGRFNNFGNAAPWMPAPTRQQQQQLQRIETEITLAQKQLDSSLREAARAQRRWEKSLPAFPARHWFPGDELVLHHPLDQDATPLVREMNRAAPPEDPSDDEP